LLGSLDEEEIFLINVHKLKPYLVWGKLQGEKLTTHDNHNGGNNQEHSIIHQNGNPTMEKIAYFYFTGSILVSDVEITHTVVVTKLPPNLGANCHFPSNREPPLEEDREGRALYLNFYKIHGPSRQVKYPSTYFYHERPREELQGVNHFDQPTTSPWLPFLLPKLITLPPRRRGVNPKA
jgi:hypothetical protein